MNEMKLEDRFNEFILQNQREFDNNYVDYLGINISASCDRELVFKIYYNDKTSHFQSHPLIDFLEGKGMIRYLTMVQDKKGDSKIRFDIGIKNRTNQNMMEVFEWLGSNTQIFVRNSTEIKKLSSMKVTNLENYDYAGLYFLGFISVDDKISVLKCHYFNRVCENPDVLYKNISFADDYYLEFLSKSGIRKFAELTDLAKKTLKLCGGHLWMSGSDYSLTSSSKYKIYIKNSINIYEGLLKSFSEEKYKYLKEQIYAVKNWNEQHREFFCEGFAICIDEQETISINFYFRM